MKLLQIKDNQNSISTSFLFVPLMLFSFETTFFVYLKARDVRFFASIQKGRRFRLLLCLKSMSLSSLVFIPRAHPVESFLPVTRFYRVRNEKIKYYDSVLGSKFVYVCQVLIVSNKW